MSAAIDLTTLISAEELSKVLGVTEQELRALHSRQEGPPYIPLSASHTVYARADVLDWLARRRVVPGAVSAAAQVIPTVATKTPAPARLPARLSRPATSESATTPMNETERLAQARIQAARPTWAKVRYPLPLPARDSLVEWRHFGFSPRLSGLLASNRVATLNGLFAFADEDVLTYTGFGPLYAAELAFHCDRLLALATQP